MCGGQHLLSLHESLVVGAALLIRSVPHNAGQAPAQQQLCHLHAPSTAPAHSGCKRCAAAKCAEAPAGREGDVSHRAHSKACKCWAALESQACRHMALLPAKGILRLSSLDVRLPLSRLCHDHHQGQGGR